MKRYLYPVVLFFLLTSVAFATSFTSFQTGNFNDASTWDGTDYSTFPILVSETIQELKTTTHGGNVQNSEGYDIVFASDSSCSIILNFEIESYASTTGQIVAWVVAPTLNYSTDTTFYICYGNNLISTDQSNKNDVWDSNYVMVQHLSGTSTLSTLDSTINNNNGNMVGSVGTTTGKIGISGNFNGVNNNYINVPNSSSLAITADISLSAWIKSSSPAVYQSILNRMAGLQSYALYVDYSTYIGFVMRGTSENSMLVNPEVPPNDGNWKLLTATYDGTFAKIYINGVLVRQVLNTGSITDSGSDLRIGDDILQYGNAPFLGQIDEARVSNTSRSPSWIATEYNNQSSPSTFYSVGSEVYGGAPHVYSRTITIDHTKVENIIPDSYDNVIISNGTTVSVPNSTTLIFENLTINSGGVLNFGTNTKILYYGSYFNNGSISFGSGSSISKALVPALQTSIDDNTPTFTIPCVTGANVELLLLDSTALASGTCLNNTISLTTSALSPGEYSFSAKETDGSGVRTTGAVISEVDSIGDVGFGSSQIIGSDGFSRISYYDYTNNALKYVRCTNINCTSKNISVIDPSAHTDLGSGVTSMRLGSDGFARIAYGDVDASGGGIGFKSLKYLVCNDDNCTSPTVSTIDTPASGKSGKMVSLVLDSSDTPFIAYHKGGGDGGGGNLMLARYMGSGGTGCTGNSAWKCTSVDTGIQWPSIALGSDGFPRISYDKIINPGWTGDRLAYVKCSDVDCSSKTITIVDDSANLIGHNSSLILDANDLAIIAYSDDTNDDLKLAICLNSTCSSVAKSIIDSNAGSFGPKNPSILLDSNGFVRLAYNTYTFDNVGNLMYIECTNFSCSSRNTKIIDTEYYKFSGTITTTGMALGPDTIPRFVYYDNENLDLKFARLEFTTVNITAPAQAPSNGPIFGGSFAPIKLLVPMALIETTTPAPQVTVPPQPNQGLPTIALIPTKSWQVKTQTKSLQSTLNLFGFTVSLSGPGSPGNETNIFGNLTLKALQKFQCEYKIVCSGKPNTTGFGKLGPRTKAKIDELLVLDKSK